MVRVTHQKSAKQATSSNNVRGPKAAKQRKNHKVVIESDSQDKEKSRAVLSFHANPPPGYTFIPAGNPQLTAALKEFAKRGNHKILAVTTTPHASRHELSREVHRIGFHFPTEVVSQVCNHYGIRLTSGGKLVEEKDDDKLFMRLYQRGQLVLDEKVRDQVTINTEAKQIIQDLFPNIPDNDLFQIIKTAFQLGDGKVGTADEIPLVRRAQLSVVAHIRHCYTNYDKLLRAVPYSEARHRVESITLQKLIDWRGDDQNDKHAMDDTLREVVVISDEEDSDDVEEGQLLENEDLRVQPLNGTVHQNHTDGRPRSPIEIHSDDEAPRGYRYVPQIVRRIPVPDAQAVLVARQQSRYAVWDRVRQEYQNSGAPHPARTVERILIDNVPATYAPPIYINKEQVYVPEPLPRRVTEPMARVNSQPSPSTYIRGADGQLYERVTAFPEQVAPSPPLRQAKTPPPMLYETQYKKSCHVSPHPAPPRLHRRTESFETHDGTVLPSIEGSGNSFVPSTNRYNPFDEPRPNLQSRNSGNFQINQRPAAIIDLTSSAEQATKRRRVEGTPPSPYVIRQSDRGRDNYEQHTMRIDSPYQRDENTHPSQHRRLIPLENPGLSRSSQRFIEGPESRMQPTMVYREDFTHQGVQSPHSTTGTRHAPPDRPSEPYYLPPARVIEYVTDSSHTGARSYPESAHQQVSSYAAKPTTSDRSGRVIYDDVPYGEPSGHRAESTTRYVRSEVHNPFEVPPQSQYYVQDPPPQRVTREYASSIPVQYSSTREVHTPHVHMNDSNYHQTRMPPPPPPLPSTVYRG